MYDTFSSSHFRIKLSVYMFLPVYKLGKCNLWYQGHNFIYLVRYYGFPSQGVTLSGIALQMAMQNWQLAKLQGPICIAGSDYKNLDTL